MEIYLMRHGEALNANEWSGSDMDRPLSPIGIAKLEKGLDAMVESGFLPRRLVVSPLVRARQSADVIVTRYPGLRPVISSALSSGAKLETLQQLVLENITDGSLWIVGHMPDLAIFAARIVGEPSLLERGLAPGDVVAVEVEPTSPLWGRGRMVWSRSLKDWQKLKRH
jgi:phosphohistidine phosphatase